jgi:hypothetical protein
MRKASNKRNIAITAFIPTDKIEESISPTFIFILPLIFYQYLTHFTKNIHFSIVLLNNL